MKILIIAFANSIHTVRWVAQVRDQGWDVRIFPSLDLGIVHPALLGLPVYHGAFGQTWGLRGKLWSQRFSLLLGMRAKWGTLVRPRLFPGYRERQLERVIRDFQPDIVHSLEFQSAGYLTLDVKKKLGKDFPSWIATNWGSDIYHFRQFPEHEEKIREVLQHCDYYSCECQRDVCLAEAFGFKGRALPVYPNTGGFDLEHVVKLRAPGVPSQRRLIMLKGYQGWAGRALVGLQALRRCADVLHGYEVAIYSADPEVVPAAERFQQDTGIKVAMIPKNTPHDEILKLHGRARLALGVSISDAISTSLLEALVMGAFPIQSWTACADEWLEDGVSGLLVPPEDPAAIAAAVRKALGDDALVDKAADINWELARTRLEYGMIRDKTLAFYREVFDDLDTQRSGH